MSGVPTARPSSTSIPPTGDLVTALLDTVFTVGCRNYGPDPAEFVRGLREAGVDVVVDVRRRRAARGATWKWLNAKRLEVLLSEAGIAYFHSRALLIPEELRIRQKRADSAARVAKHARAVLAPAVVREYRAQVLACLAPAAVAGEIARFGHRPALLCAEREPAACHRSLAAEWLSAVSSSAVVTHL